MAEIYLYGEHYRIALLYTFLYARIERLKICSKKTQYHGNFLYAGYILRFIVVMYENAFTH